MAGWSQWTSTSRLGIVSQVCGVSKILRLKRVTHRAEEPSKANTYTSEPIRSGQQARLSAVT